MKLYKRQVRAVAEEHGDLHWKLGKKEYHWYDEEDFPSNMEEIVKKDNPFGGWYGYEIEERFIEI